jgi:hypothetical protein
VRTGAAFNSTNALEINMNKLIRHFGIVLTVLVASVAATTEWLSMRHVENDNGKVQTATAIILPKVGSAMEQLTIHFDHGSASDLLINYADQAKTSAEAKYEAGQIVQIACDMPIVKGESKPRKLRSSFIKQPRDYRGEPVYLTVQGRFADDSPWLDGKRLDNGTFEDHELFAGGMLKEHSIYFWYQPQLDGETPRWRVQSRQVFDEKGFQLEDWDMDAIGNLHWWVRTRQGDKQEFLMIDNMMAITELDFKPGSKEPFREMRFQPEYTILKLYDEQGQIDKSFMWTKEGSVIATKWQNGKPLFDQVFDTDSTKSTPQHRVLVLANVIELNPYEKRGFRRIFFHPDGTLAQIFISSMRDLDQAEGAVYLPPPFSVKELCDTPELDRSRTAWQFDGKGRAKTFGIYNEVGEPQLEVDLEEARKDGTRLAPKISDYPETNPEFLVWPDFPPPPQRPAEPLNGCVLYEQAAQTGY